MNLQNFIVEEVKENFRLIKHQPKQLKLSQSTVDLKQEMNPLVGGDLFLNCLPIIQLTSLEDVDDKPNGSFVGIFVII